MIDPETGLPKVADNQYWFIGKPENGWGYFSILLMEKYEGKTLFGRTKQKTRVVFQHSGNIREEQFIENPKASIRESCYYVLGVLAEREKQARILASDIWGAYPPKKL